MPSIPPGPLSEPSARELTRALERLEGLLRLRTTPPLALIWQGSQPNLTLFPTTTGADDEEGSTGSAPSFSFAVHLNPRCEDGRLLYDEYTVHLYGGVSGEVV